VGSNLGKDIGLGFFTHRTGYNVTFADGSGIYFDDSDGSIAEEKVPYDDETDSFTFAALNDRGDAPDGSPPTMRIYEIWHDMSFLPSQ
jgi:prepilin-type processing-associated H-X9-DG protein